MPFNVSCPLIGWLPRSFSEKNEDSHVVTKSFFVFWKQGGKQWESSALEGVALGTSSSQPSPVGPLQGGGGELGSQSSCVL